ncbi:uncharacterized protein LOC127840781 [Dreissena polymorpha]|uniref:uncharacterized protein LOC127840781 n=1 Tax=Dreissena polymorpha TaxID=45954 RepID=UPI002263B9D8|nr:uncharacterized protein LOC127840781 [Dreissena polymorpha]
MWVCFFCRVNRRLHSSFTTLLDGKRPARKVAGFLLLPVCRHDSDCHCTDNFQAKCTNSTNRHICGTCHPVKCLHDSDCHCNVDNFQARCYKDEHESYCTPCLQVSPAPSTTAAVIISTPVPTPEQPQSDCSEFDPTLHRWHDSSACFLPHMLEVLFSDPKQARYCAVQCGCC